MERRRRHLHDDDRVISGVDEIAGIDGLAAPFISKSPP